MKKRMWYWDALLVAGIVAIVSGVAMESVPWAFVVGGVCAVIIAAVGGLLK